MFVLPSRRQDITDLNDTNALVRQVLPASGATRCMRVVLPGRVAAGPGRIISMPESWPKWQNALNCRQHLTFVRTGRILGHKPVPESLEWHIRQLDAEIEAFDKLIKKSIEENEEFRHKNQLLQTVPGISKAISPVLVAMPDEAGKVSRRQIAALAGLAPFNHDSGTLKGHRAIAGGRRRVRRALYMAALGATGSNARLAEKYRQMRKDGKAGKVALIALARKIVTIINAMLKTNTSFQ